MSRPAKVVLLTFLGLILLVVILPGIAPWMMDVLFHLALGWVAHAISVMPQVTVNWSGVGMLVLCLALAAGIGHWFCRWLWQGTGHPDGWRPRWTVAGLGVIVLMFGAGMAFTAVAHQTGWLVRAPEPLVTSSYRASFERQAFTCLKIIYQAQMELAAKDWDGNKIRDYWRKDIAGLYALKGENGRPIELIELSTAAADAAPLTSAPELPVRSPKGGYWFRTLGFRDEIAPDPARFSALAYPEGPSFGKYYFIISHEGVLYRKPVDAGPPPDVYPDHPEKDGWQKLD